MFHSNDENGAHNGYINIMSSDSDFVFVQASFKSASSCCLRRPVAPSSPSTGDISHKEIKMHANAENCVAHAQHPIDIAVAIAS